MQSREVELMRHLSVRIFAGVVLLIVMLPADAGIDSSEDPVLVEGSR